VATREARRAGRELLPEHLLAAAVDDPRGGLARLLSEAGVGPGDARTAVRQRFGLPETADATDVGESIGARPDQRGRRRETPDTPLRRPTPPAAAHLAPRRKRKLPWRALMLVAVPISVALAWTHQSPILVFVFTCLAVLPIAGYMGEATEHLAQKTGPTIGGLLNATFGNAAELIIAIAALRAGLIELVKASITGSILGNLLLILGLSILAGGTKRSEIRFNRTAAGMSSAMLALAVVGLLLPALFHAVHPEAAARATEMWMSEWVAAILIGTYGLSLLFSLKTHRRLFGGDAHPLAGPVWGTGKAVLILALATVGIAIESEILVHATQAVTRSLQLSEVFLGLIVVPLIGNAAEHAAAIVVARKGQMDLALQIALGSSTQIAVLVFVGLIMGRPMSLVFSQFEVMVLALSTLVVAILTHDGESHWFEGVQLLAVYAMVAVAAFFI
jgi:Ca2+:H+ antiporter